jgi:hypothetical protein
MTVRGKCYAISDGDRAGDPFLNVACSKIQGVRLKDPEIHAMLALCVTGYGFNSTTVSYLNNLLYYVYGKHSWGQSHHINFCIHLKCSIFKICYKGDLLRGLNNVIQQKRNQSMSLELK